MDHNDKSKLPFPFNFPPEPSSSFPLASVDNSVNFPFFSQFQFDSPAENGGAKPLYCFQGNVVPPFLSKTYDIVDDPSLDPIISWGERGDSFIVWETADFSTIVLPRYFKHANFSSFVRQLNTYVPQEESFPFLKGFRKIEADKWEFANEFFLQGSKHLLKNIQRRRPRQHHQISGGESSGLVEMEKSVMMQEMEEMHQQNRETAARIESIKKRLQASEQRQKQMFSFVAKTVRCLPGCIPKTRRKIVKKKTQEQGDDEQIEFKPELHYPEFQDSLHHSVNIQVGSAGVSDYGDGEFSAIQNRYLVDYSLDGFSDAWDLSPIQEEGRLEVEKRQYD